MPLNSSDLVQRLNRLYPKKIDLSLGRIERLLKNLGNPHEHLPPVIHVAGTNGKGSLISFMRAISEAAGLKVHVYTSPHLVQFNERIRIAGDIISNDKLISLLNECELVNEGHPITFFELTTAIAFLAFSRTPADLVLLETGLGGRLDATNVLTRPAVTALTPISVDHVEFLGSHVTNIAAEKAAIMRKGVISVIANQERKVNQVIAAIASNVGALCQFQGQDWDFGIPEDKFNIQTSSRNSYYSLPNLQGAHQLQNAAQAITCLDALKKVTFSHKHVEFGLLNAKWPGRLQQLNIGPLMESLSAGWEIWVDGGHNAAAGTILAQQARIWSDRPLFAILGMIKTKNPGAFIAPLCPYLAEIMTVEIEAEESTIKAGELALLVNEKGLRATPMPSIRAAIEKLMVLSLSPARVLICGSLYLAGQVLDKHN